MKTQNNTTSSVQQNGEPVKKKFNAQTPFSHKPPYDPVFAERVPLLHAFSLALGNYRTLNRPRSGRHIEALRALFRSSVPFRAAECGVFFGNSLLACASIARDQGVKAEFFGLDTFEGLPPLSDIDKQYAPPTAKYRTQKMFTETSVNVVSKLLNDAGFDKEIHLVPGLFENTLPTLPERQYHFVNIDCDLYEPHIQCLEYFYPRMVKGGIVFFDDYHSIDYPMARQAIDKFMADKTERLLHLRFGPDGANITKTYFVKY